MFYGALSSLHRGSLEITLTVPLKVSYFETSLVICFYYYYQFIHFMSCPVSLKTMFVKTKIITKVVMQGKLISVAYTLRTY